MTAWTKGLDTAPTDRPILVRVPAWDCPAVMMWQTEHGESFWSYCEPLLLDVAGGLVSDEIEGAEWAELPR
jgi:hypothetical protein